MWDGICRNKKLVKCNGQVVDCGGDRLIIEWINPHSLGAQKVFQESVETVKQFLEQYRAYNFSLAHYLIYAVWGWINKNISYKYDDKYPDYWNDPSETYTDRWGDCLFPDTPVIILKGGMPDLVEIADLLPPNADVNTKYYCDDIYILCGHHKEHGSIGQKFYPVNWIIKKVSYKPRVRIRTGKSVFDVTSDHRIKCRNGMERTFKTPLEANEDDHFVKTRLPFTVFANVYGSKLDDELAYDLGWLYGFFAAEGSCGRGWWKIRNTDEALLERAKRIVEECCGISRREN